MKILKGKYQAEEGKYSYSNDTGKVFREASLCYNLYMRLPSSRIGWALIPGAIILGLSGLAVASQSGLFSGSLETEAREYATVVWGVAGVLIISSLVIIVLNYIKERKDHDSVQDRKTK